MRALLILVFTCSATFAADFASELMEATFKLFHPDSTATCFLVKRDAPDTALYVITAAHVLERTKGETMILVLRRPKDDGSFERLDHTIPVRRDNKPLWVKHEKHDVAVLKLTTTLPVAVAAMPAALIAGAAELKAANVHICSPLFVFTYPQRFEANGAGFPVARQGIFAGPPLLPAQTHPTFHADFTTFAGDSGGPVFIAGSDGHPLVVGIVLSQQRHDEKVKTEYEELTIHHPLGIGTVLHAQYVRETLDLAAKQPAPTSAPTTAPAPTSK
ncbi:MAG TPA: serine protease [Planctomycetota bacterium]|jgi:hypothetical protein